MMKHIFSSFLMAGLVFVSILIPSQVVVYAQQATLASEQAYKLIKEAESTMTLIDLKLSEIQQQGSLPINSGVVMEVSLGEISGKLEVSKALLDRAVQSYQNEDYTTAAILAFRSKQNSILTTLYLEGLMNKATSSLGVSRLELQGTFADLLRLRGLLQPVTIPPTTDDTGDNGDNQDPNTDTTGDTGGDSTGSGDGNTGTTTNDGTDNTDSNDNSTGTTTSDSNDTATSTTGDGTPPVVVVPTDPKVTACVEKNIVTCNNQETTCIGKVKALVNTCQAKFDTAAANCKRYETRSATYLVKCQTNLTTCLSTNIAAKNLRCQTRFGLCQLSAKVSQERDLNTAKTCLAKQVAKQATCETAFSTKTTTLLARCTSNYTTCENRIKTRCIAAAAPKVKAVKTK
ncbi:MAG: hypothetical protein K8Q91_03225 [Candidatus Vogelbacteria bacterium]|nr:hypothetical protein [Candidatus Vogelbacteria bacterium]